MRFCLPLVLILILACSSNKKDADPELEERASGVTIIRDRWGVPHIYGKTDADAVFGLMYAQCEESFERVERNYLQVLGRMSEVEGEAYLWQDLQMKIIYDTAAAIEDYKKAPQWLKDLLHAFADGIHYYLYKHPEVQPALLKKFEPWFPLLFTDGAYIATKTAGITPDDLRKFYGNGNTGSIQYKTNETGALTGSNAFAIAPSKSASGNALLYINPHVSFYFRTEAHVVSQEGLNAYGAVTWGQFFVFQGFNDHCGWMHTSSAVDVADLYEEKVSNIENKFFYAYDGKQLPVSEKKFEIGLKGGSDKKAITVYYTHHGPAVAQANGKWLTLKEQNRSMNSLIQSWQRMKAKSFADFKTVMQQRANSTTNTMYADADGNIAYWHGNFIPKRNEKFNWSLPVDGSTPATEWQGLHDVQETVQAENPPQGFLQNCNSTPFSVAGLNSIPKKFPFYMAPEGENFRAIRAIDQIQNQKGFTLDKLIATGYDHYLPVFDSLLPSLFSAYSSLSSSDNLKALLFEPIQLLKQWDKRSSAQSTITALAIFWAGQLIGAANVADAETQLEQISLTVHKTSARQKLQALQGVMAGLQKMYGTWKVQWGEINRYQRIKGGFDDNAESFPVGIASAFFGSLPSYETVWGNGNKQYGIAGNSFVAAVEFLKNSPSGKKIKAKSIVAGGQYFSPASKHYTDQAKMFIEGKFKDVLFYNDEVEKNATKKYHPGRE